MIHLRVERRTVLGAMPFFALIALAAGVSYGYDELLRAQRDRIDHTYRVLSALDGAFASIVDAETGQRGFVITGDEDYLVPYREASQDMPRSIARLRALVVDRVDQYGRVATLERALDDKLTELQRSIAARREGGFRKARELVVENGGKALMDRIRTVLADLRRTEEGLLRDRSDDARRTEHRLLAVTVFCASLSIVARIGLALRRPRPEAR